MTSRMIIGFVFCLIGVSCLGQKIVYKELNDAVITSMSSGENSSDRMDEVLNECELMDVEYEFKNQFSLISVDETLSQTEIVNPSFLVSDIVFLDGSTLRDDKHIVTIQSLLEKYNIDREEGLHKLPLKGIEREVLNRQRKGYFVFGVWDRRLVRAISFSLKFRFKNYKTYILVEEKTKVSTDIGDVRLVSIGDKKAVINYPYSTDFEIDVEGVSDDGRIVPNVSINTMSIREEVMSETDHAVEKRRVDNLIFNEPIAGVMIKTVVFNKKEEQLTFKRFVN